MERVDSIELDEEFIEIDSASSKLELEDFFRGSNLDFIHDLLNRKLGMLFKYQASSVKFPILPEDVKEAAKFLVKSRSMFWDALAMRDAKQLLIALIIFRRFELDYTLLFDSSQLDQEQRSWLVGCLMKLLSLKTSVDVEVNANVPEYEKKLLQSYQVGFENLDIRRVYEFIEALERSNIFYSHYLSDEARKVLYYVDVDQFDWQLQQKTELLEIIAFLKNLSFGAKLFLLNKKRNFNEWTLFETVRQLLQKKNSNSWDQENIEILSTGIERVYEKNSVFFSDMNSYFLGNIVYNSALGKVLATIELKHFKEFINRIEFSKYKDVNKLRAFCELLSCLDKYDSDTRTILFCRSIYKKWEIFLQSKYGNGEYLFKPTVTDYFCVLLGHLQIKLDTRRKAVRAVGKIVQSLEEIQSRWFKNAIERTSFYFVQLSKLYLLSFLWREQDFEFASNSRVKNSLTGFLSDKRFHILNRGIGEGDYYLEMSKNFGLEKK